MKKIILHSSLVILCIFFFSCKDRNEYRVPEEIAVIVDRFEKEAAARGRNFDFKNSGLIIEFADLEDNAAGLCHFEKPIRIEIDTDYWNRMKNFAGAESIHEELIFHEIGHGILNRKHHKALLDNGEWKSLMCGGDSVEGRTWNINYRGLRRDYYLNELFNQNTPVPEFVTTSPPAEFSTYVPVYAEHFDWAETTDWKLKESPTSSATIENGRLAFRSYSNSNMLILTKIGAIDVQSDFSFEISLTAPDVTPTSKYGLAFGTLKSGSYTESIDYILINNNQEKFFGNSSWFSYFTKLRENNIIPKGKNILKVAKKGDLLYYFINGKFVYHTEIENKQQGYSYGFMVPANETIYVDDFIISSSNKSMVSSRIKGIDLPMEFEAISIELPENKLHYK